MKHLTLFFIYLSVACFPFVEIQYKETPPSNFEFFVNSSTMGDDDDSTTPPSILYYGVNFKFDSIGYGFNIYPIEISDSSYSWTSHNVYYQLFEDQHILFLNASLQIGAVNIGLPSSAVDSIFNEYLQTYYITHKFQWYGVSNFSFYVSTASNQAATIYPYYGLEYLYGKNRAFLEYSSVQKQVYLGGEVYFNKSGIFTFGTNLTTSDPDTSADYFFPTIQLGVRFLNPFVKEKPKPKIVRPLEIDSDSYLKLEKGLLSFYESDYKEALTNYLAVIEKYPNFSLGHTRTGNTYYRLNQLELAKKHWQIALKLDPGNKDLVFALKQLDEDKLIETKLINE